MTGNVAPLLESLSDFDSGTICNAIELFGIRPQTWGYTRQQLQAADPAMRSVVGFASTMTFRSSQPGLGDHSYSLEDHIERFAELSGTPFVLIQDLDDEPNSAIFGEIMCSEFQAFGAAGLATNGLGRDYATVRGLGFPVFCGGWAPGRGYARFPDLHVPIVIAGLLIRPDDLVVADGSGLVQVPHQIAHELPQVAEAYQRAERDILEAIGADNPSLSRISEARKARAEACARIGKELGAKKRS